MPATDSDINGGANDYATIVLWEATENANHTAPAQITKGHLHGLLNSAAVTIDGGTSDASSYLLLDGDEGDGRHDGTGGTGARLTMSGVGHLFTVSDDYFRIQWLGIADSGSSMASSNEVVRLNNTGFYMQNCVVGKLDANGGHDAIYAGVGSLTITVENTIFYDIDRAACFNQAQTNNTWNIYHCTGYNIRASNRIDYSSVGTENDKNNDGCTFNIRDCAFDRGASTNNAVYDKGTSGGTTSWGTSDYNASSDTSSSAFTNNIQSFTADTEWLTVTDGSEDLHLESASQFDDAGEDITAVTDIDTDIDGVTRTTHSYGADELTVAAGGLSIPIAAYHYNHHLKT